MKLTGLNDFLKKEHPEMFDFKDLMGEYYLYWKDKHKGDPEYQALLEHLPEMGTKNNIEKWFLYKTLDADLNKRILRFDCDSWNGTCELTEQIYKQLWSDVPVKNVRFGGDTMNSFAYTFNYLANKKSFRESFKYYQSEDKESFWRDADQILGRLAQHSGCLGNFTLIPTGFNRFRGSCLGDFFDLSLIELRDNEEKWFGAKGVFPQYINVFFLWDYIQKSDKDGEYVIKPFFEGHSKEQLFPIDKVEQLRIIDTINANILQRGKFMVDMLHIALNQPKRYEKIQLHLSKPDTHFSDLKKAEKYIKETFL